jgi:hypothetical protein
VEGIWRVDRSGRAQVLPERQVKLARAGRLRRPARDLTQLGDDLIDATALTDPATTPLRDALTFCRNSPSLSNLALSDQAVQTTTRRVRPEVDHLRRQVNGIDGIGQHDVKNGSGLGHAS